MISERWLNRIERGSVLLGLAVGLAASAALDESALRGALLRDLVLLGCGVGVVLALQSRRWAGTPLLAGIAAFALGYYLIPGPPSRQEPAPGWWPDFALLVGALAFGEGIGMVMRARLAAWRGWRRTTQPSSPSA